MAYFTRFFAVSTKIQRTLVMLGGPASACQSVSSPVCYIYKWRMSTIIMQYIIKLLVILTISDSIHVRQRVRISAGKLVQSTLVGEVKVGIYIGREI